MNKIKVFILLFCIALAVSVAYLIVENSTYQAQIEERDRFIRRLLIKDSLSSRLLDIEELDTMLIIKYNVSEDGHPLTYDELWKDLCFYRRQVEIQDWVIVKAKQYYNFNYRIKELGDTLIIDFWEK